MINKEKFLAMLHQREGRKGHAKITDLARLLGKSSQHVGACIDGKKKFTDDDWSTIWDKLGIARCAVDEGVWQ
jgi:hypothetical protein